jgi:hypothetical protein
MVRAGPVGVRSNDLSKGSQVRIVEAAMRRKRGLARFDDKRGGSMLSAEHEHSITRQCAQYRRHGRTQRSFRVLTSRTQSGLLWAQPLSQAT